MKNPNAEAALELKLGIEAGVVEKEEVIRWADSILGRETYNDDVANISLATNSSAKEIEALLGKIANGLCEWDGLRWVLGRLHKCLVSQPNKMHEFIQFLERIWIRNGYDVPADMHFIVGLEDAYLLAEEAQYGYMEEIRSDFLMNLSRFCGSMPEACES
jgi:hypothetical protein